MTSVLLVVLLFEEFFVTHITGHPSSALMQVFEDFSHVSI